MTPERHQQIKRLFLAAVELAPEEIQAFLDQACAGDVELREEVQSLLNHHRTDTLLEPAASQNTEVLPNTTILSAMREALGSGATNAAH